jgi:hypothetical protein
MMINDLGPMLTASEVADMLHLHVNTVKRPSWPATADRHILRVSVARRFSAACGVRGAPGPRPRAGLLIRSCAAVRL